MCSYCTAHNEAREVSRGSREVLRRVKGRPPTDSQKARLNLVYARIYRRAFTALYHEVRALQGHGKEDLLYREAIKIRSEMDEELDGLYVDGDRGAPWRCLEENCPHPLNHEGGHG